MFIFQFLDDRIHDHVFFLTFMQEISQLHVKKYTFLKNDIVLLSLYIFEGIVFFLYWFHSVRPNVYTMID